MRRILRVVLGSLAIGAGLLLLAANLSQDLPNRESIAAAAFGLTGFVVLLLFALTRRLWQLPLGCALLTVGGLQWLYVAGLDSFYTIAGGALLGAGGLFVGLYLNRGTQWGWLLPGYLLWVVGGTLLLGGLSLPLDWLATLGAWALATLFVLIFAGNRGARWALTPAYLAWALGVGVRLAWELVATWAAWALALPFWVGYLRDDARRSRLWAAGVLTVAGALPLLFTPQPGYWLAIGVSAGVGLAWLATLARDREEGRA